MEALRIHLKQASANYKREEIVENKMTYPLPPFSTVIGALHKVCGFNQYHPMDISIQGDFHSLGKEAYIDHCFLNTTQDDRNILVKMYNPEYLSSGYEKVAFAMKPQNNSFRNNITIMVENEELIKEYQDLKELNDKISGFKKGKYTDCLKRIKARKISLKDKKKQLDKHSIRYKKVELREKEIIQYEKSLKEKVKIFEEENYKKPIAKFRTLTKSLKYCEVLSDVELIIHVKSDKDVLDKILEHVYDLKSLGRSEDFVDVISASIVELDEKADREYKSNYHAYIDADLVDGENEDIIFKDKRYGIPAQGTKYYLNKNYIFLDKNRTKRIFEKKKVYYMSDYKVDTESNGVYIDKSGEKPLIVVFA